jgi:hypothetical protein
MSMPRSSIRTSRVLFGLVILSELLTIFLSPTDTFWDSIVACRAVSRQLLGKHVPVATDTHVGHAVFYSVRAKAL